MPQLTLPILPDGLIVQVMIHLEAATVSGLLTSGQTVPAPLVGRGLIDTGTTITAVAPGLLHRLGIPSAGQASTQTAAGALRVNLFRVSLSILATDQASLLLVRPTLLVTELTAPIPDTDVLIGRDVILEGLLVVNGPMRQFTLAV